MVSCITHFFLISYNWMYFFNLFCLTCDLFKNLFTKYLRIFLMISCSLFLFSSIMIWLRGKESACQYRSHRKLGFDPWVERILWRRKWQPTPGSLPGKPRGQRSLAGCSPWDAMRQTWLSVHTRYGLRHALCNFSFPTSVKPCLSCLCCHLDTWSFL